MSEQQRIERYIEAVLAHLGVEPGLRAKVAEDLQAMITSRLEQKPLDAVLAELGAPEALAAEWAEGMELADITVPKQRARSFPWLKVAAAATALILLLGIGLWSLRRPSDGGGAAAVGPLRLSLIGQVAVPDERYGSQRLLAADLDGDGRLELIGINLPTAYVLKEGPTGWERLWQGFIVGPEERSHWMNKGEVLTAQVGHFTDGPGESVAISVHDASLQVQDLVLTLTWDPEQQGLVAAVTVELPKRRNPIPFHTGPALERTEDGLFLYGPAQLTDEDAPIQLARWKLERGVLTMVARGPALYQDASFLNRFSFGYFEGRPVIAAVYGLTCAACHDGWIRTVIHDARSLEPIAVHDGLTAAFLGGSPEQDSWLLEIGPGQVALQAPSGPPRLAARTDAAIQLRDPRGQLLGETALPTRYPYQSHIALPAEDQIAVADPDGLTILALTQDGALEPIWRGIDFRGLELIAAVDLDGDGRPELLSERGDIFRQDESGRYRFASIQPGPLSEGWRPASSQHLVKHLAETLSIARWDGSVLGELPSGELLGSWDLNGDALPDLLIAHSGAPHAIVTLYSGADLSPLGSFPVTIPAPWMPEPRPETVSFLGIPVPPGPGQVRIYANVRDQAGKYTTYQLDWRVGETQASVTTVEPSVILPGMFASGPAQVGWLEPGERWVAVGFKYNTPRSALSLMQEGEDGRPWIQEISLSEYGHPSILSFLLVDLTGDGRVELLVNTGGGALLFAIQ